MLDDVELKHLRRCVELATEALDAGDEPFGSVLVSGDGRVLAEDRNRVAGGDKTAIRNSSWRVGQPPT